MKMENKKHYWPDEVENGEAESQRQGKPRLTERLEMIRELLQSKKP